jgi:hypothetical protein
MPTAPTAASTATMLTMTAWIACERHIRPTRSWRSTIAPAGSDSSSQGRKVAAETIEISRGSWVIVTASSGRAAANAPSPRLSTATAHHSRQ